MLTHPSMMTGAGGTRAIIIDDRSRFVTTGSSEIPFIDDSTTVDACALLNGLILKQNWLHRGR